MRKLFATLLACLPLSLFAATATISWDPVLEPGVVGYRVYWGPLPGVYTNHADVVECEAIIGGLWNGQHYCFAISTRGELGLESEKTDPICVDMPPLDAPTNLRFVSWELTWSIDFVSAELAGFQVFLKEVGVKGEQVWTITDPLARSFFFPVVLYPQSTYQFWVRCFARQGQHNVAFGDSERFTWTEPVTTWTLGPWLTPPALLENGAGRVIYFDALGLHPTLWRSDDLVSWRSLGTMKETTPGQYREWDSVSDHRFYRVSK